jgi:hypothetical protein
MQIIERTKVIYRTMYHPSRSKYCNDYIVEIRVAANAPYDYAALPLRLGYSRIRINSGGASRMYLSQQIIGGHEMRCITGRFG